MAERSEEAAEEKFEASRRWFMKFQDRSRLHHLKVQREAASADIQATVIQKNLVKIIIELPTY